MRSKNSLYALFVAGAAFVGVSAVNPARAVGVTPEFEIIENPNLGIYTVINNSADEWIYAFSVTNPAAPTDNVWTTQPGWIAGKTFTFHPLTATGFSYAALLPFSYALVPETIKIGRHTITIEVPKISGPSKYDLGPGTYSNFFFGAPIAAASTFTLDLICSDAPCTPGTLSTFSDSPTVTPLPSTWLMLLSGFAGLAYFAYRGTKKNAAAFAAA